MSNLYRELAPVSASSWDAIDSEAKRTLKRILAGRRVVDFRGPLGYRASAISRGRVSPIKASMNGLTASIREFQPLLEHRIDFELQREQIEAIDRGAKDPDLGSVVKVAQAVALAEDGAIFSGVGDAGISGMIEVAEDHALPLTTEYERYPVIVASALTWLRNQGIDGPYSIALGPRCYKGLTETSNKGGYPILDLVRQQIDGEIIWAPAIAGAIVLSNRGGDFELFIGRDFSIGYAEHDATTVKLFIDISFTFRVYTPEAAVPLLYK